MAVAVTVTVNRVSGYDCLPAIAGSGAGRRGVVRLAGISAGFPHAVVRAALAGHPGLGVPEDWYWLSQNPSRLARIVGRLLTVCGPLPMEEVSAGVARTIRHRPTSTDDTSTDVWRRTWRRSRRAHPRRRGDPAADADAARSAMVDHIELTRTHFHRLIRGEPLHQPASGGRRASPRLT